MNGSTVKRLGIYAARWHRWGQYIAIASAYAAAYEVVRHITYSHWTLTAGLRLACLLLLPFRYWPALAVGETLPLVENAWLCETNFGPAWALSSSVPMIVLFMACVKPLRVRWTLYDDRGQLRMELLLAATLGCALITAVSTSLTLETALLSSPGAWPDISLVNYFWAYILGAYLGALTLTPILLALAERARQIPNTRLGDVSRSPMLRDVLLWLPVLAVLTTLAIATTDDTIRQLARLGLLWPTIALAWRHGWHGTAVGGFAASVALAMTGTVLLDPAMVRAQVVLALALSGLLAVGPRAPRVVRVAVPVGRS